MSDTIFGVTHDPSDTAVTVSLVSHPVLGILGVLCFLGSNLVARMRSLGNISSLDPGPVPWHSSALPCLSGHLRCPLILCPGSHRVVWLWLASPSSRQARSYSTTVEFQPVCMSCFPPHLKLKPPCPLSPLHPSQQSGYRNWVVHTKNTILFVLLEALSVRIFKMEVCVIRC